MTGEVRIRILTVDDHPLLLEGIATVINDQPGMVLIGQALGGNAAIQKFREHRPDITLMDLRMPDLGGIDALIAIRGEFPEARIIVLTTFDGDVEVQRALKAGACGYVLKKTEPRELVEAILRVHAGKRWVPPEVAANLAEHLANDELTAREIEVLRKVAGGNRNREIGAALFIAEDTVKAHMKNIMDKLGAKDRTQAIAIAVRRGIIQL